MKVASVHPSHRRQGFTLVELVVVVLIIGIIAAIALPAIFGSAMAAIIGIIAAIALPKMAGNTTTARENSAKQSLAVIRDAIELVRAETGSFPADAAAIATKLKGPFPSCPIGANAANATVRAAAADYDSSTGSNGWAYNVTTGNFWINDDTLRTTY